MVFQRFAVVKKMTIALALALTLALCALPVLAFAEGGKGEGSSLGKSDGSGGGGGKAVPTLVASNPEEGATLALDFAEEMWLEFSNNVADASVSADNLGKVYLQKADGSPVEADVHVVDTQVDPEHRNFIYLTPAQPLEPSASYVIVADTGITAKNGISSESEFRVTFKIADAQVPAQAAGGASSVSPESSSAASSSASGAAQESSGPNIGAIVAVLFVIVVAVTAGVGMSRKKAVEGQVENTHGEDASDE